MVTGALPAVEVSATSWMISAGFGAVTVVLEPAEKSGGVAVAACNATAEPPTAAAAMATPTSFALTASMVRRSAIECFP